MSNIRLFALAVLLLIPGLSFANQTASGFCTTGGIKVTTFGSLSSNPVQGSYLGCSVSVSIHGGGLATITDANGGALANPFTASSTNGFWQFAAANGFYDVTLSGGNPALPAPVTIVNLLLNDPNTASITQSSFTGSGFISSTALVAGSGIFRCASVDNCLVFRNISNGLDLALKKTGAAAGNLPADVLDASAFGGIKVSQFFSNSAQSAATGVLACSASDTCVSFRNQANSADIPGLAHDASDRIVIGGAAGFTASIGNITNGLTIGTTLTVGGASSLQGVTATTITASGEIAPSITGGALGDTAHRFDATIRNLDVSGTSTGITLTPPSFTVIKVDKYASWALALADCPAVGCILDATSPSSPLAMGSFDSGATRDVYVVFGPYSFTANQITLRTNLHLYGAGSVPATGYGVTKITSVGTNTTPLLVIPQVSSSPAQGVVISGIDFVGASGNTSQDGLFTDCSTLTNSGLWYAELNNVEFDGFKGIAVHMKGRADTATAVNQFITFTNVRAFRVAGGGEALRIENGNGQIKFINSEFDGPGITDGTNIFIGDLAGGDTLSPYSIDFDHLTCQSANLCMQISGGFNITVKNSHFEVLHGGHQISLVAANNSGIVFENNMYAGTVGVNAGNGFLLNSTTNSAQIIFQHNEIEGSPDHYVEGTNGNTIISKDNTVTATASFISSGTTTQMAPAATLDVQGYNIVALNPSGTSITTLTSHLSPGQTITFIALGGVQFATGGNIDLTGAVSPLVLATGETVTFARNDLSGTWRFIATTTAKLTGKTLTGVAMGNTVELLPSGCTPQGPTASINGAGAPVDIFTCSLLANTVESGKLLHVICSATHDTGTANVAVAINLNGVQVLAASTGTAASQSIALEAYILRTGITTAQTWGLGMNTTGTTQPFSIAIPAGLAFTSNQTLNCQFSVAAGDHMTGRVWAPMSIQ